MKFKNMMPGLMAFTILIASCKKESDPPKLATLNVVNASVGLATAQINYFGTKIVYATYQSNVGFGTNVYYPLKPGASSIAINSKTDTTKAVYTSVITTDPAGAYSLYLAGQASAVDAILVKDVIPFHSLTDSVVSVRFANLAYNSPPVNVTLSTTTTVNEFSNVAYKSITEFKNYPSRVANMAYVFQVRDAAGLVVASFSFTGARFLNMTLALKGMVGGTGADALSIMRINNY